MHAGRPLAVAVATAGLLVATVPVGVAHTDSDVVAVAAGSVATVTLKPTHGCGDSPSTKVSTRVPIAGARGAEVPGWTVSAVDDGAGRTVVDWTGGTLGPEEVGAFPVEFTAPDEVGEILTFPFVQECANGEELAWIDGDPAGEYPAPRLLILAPGSSPAETIDDVPADAPGRAQLGTIIDVDGQVAPTTTTDPVTTWTTRGATSPTTASEDDESSSAPLVAGAVVVAAVIGPVAFVVRRRRASSRT